VIGIQYRRNSRQLRILYTIQHLPESVSVYSQSSIISVQIEPLSLLICGGIKRRKGFGPNGSLATRSSDGLTFIIQRFCKAEPVVHKFTELLGGIKINTSAKFAQILSKSVKFFIVFSKPPSNFCCIQCHSV